MKPKGLILDDERSLVEVANMNTYSEFKDYLKSHPIPEIIQFDHDLQDFGSEGVEFTGYTCAQFLCSFCLDKNFELPTFVVHTGNPVGRKTY